MPVRHDDFFSGDMMNIDMPRMLTARGLSILQRRFGHAGFALAFSSLDAILLDAGEDAPFSRSRRRIGLGLEAAWCFRYELITPRHFLGRFPSRLFSSFPRLICRA